MREPRRDEPSETFGPYVLFECLGRGGMATVHRAKQTGIEGFERPVALKRMLPWLTSDPEFVKSFVREARLAAQLRHTNIAQTYDLGKVDGVYFIAMELIAGRDVRELLRQAHNTVGAIPVPIVIHILFQICDALDYAHNFRDEQGRQLGLVHRDISPANVIIGEDGCAKLVDFGVAKGSTATLHTQSGMLKGKFAYMAPEMLQGQVDARCDLFAVGVVAWELLTAKPLFAGGDDMEILQRVTSWDPPPPSSHNPMVPRELDAWVQMALAKTATRRFQTAAQMRAGLELVARVPSMRATGPDVAAWITWAFQQQKGKVGAAPVPMSQMPVADDDSVVVTVERAGTPRPTSDSRPPTVRTTRPSLPAVPPGMAPAQTLLVDDAAVVASSVAPPATERKATVMFGSGAPVRTSSGSIPAPSSTTQPPVAQPYVAPVAQPYAGPATGPVVAPAPMDDRSRAYSRPPPSLGPHATMIGAVVPIPVSSPSGRFSSVTSPPPMVAPSTMPPPVGQPGPYGGAPHGSSPPMQVEHPQAYPTHPLGGGYGSTPIAAEAGVTPGSRTVVMPDPPAGTPAWATAPRGDNPLRSAEYLDAAAAYGTQVARGTPEPALAGRSEAAQGPTGAPRKAGNAGLIVVVVLGVAAAIGGFFAVQHWL